MFVDSTQKGQFIKGKSGKFDYIKTKNICSANAPVKRDFDQNTFNSFYEEKENLIFKLYGTFSKQPINDFLHDIAIQPPSLTSVFVVIGRYSPHALLKSRQSSSLICLSSDPITNGSMESGTFHGRCDFLHSTLIVGG